MIVASIFALYLLSAAILPFPNWSSFAVALSSAATAPGVTVRQRLSMLLYLARDVLLLPVWALFWAADEVLYPAYRNRPIREPIFLFSQPRSGTTFLLRTLSEDHDTFLSVTHLEWRYPYITFWTLIDRLGLRGWLERRSYWPDTELGRTCREIHPHVLGNYEEFGIFLEERFYHHYFVFRRFPFPKVLERVSRFDDLSEAARDRMVSTFLRVVRKVYYYRGSDAIFLAKENENVAFCRAVVERLPDARVLMICRDPQPMLDSYHTMSVTCTEVKHGIDPTTRSGWYEANIAFRRDQCRQFVAFWRKVRQTRKAILVSFQDYTTDVLGSTLHIYREFELHVGDAFRRYLEETQAAQARRRPRYENLRCGEPGFEFYSDFVRRANRPASAAPRNPKEVLS